MERSRLAIFSTVIMYFVAQAAAAQSSNETLGRESIVIQGAPTDDPNSNQTVATSFPFADAQSAESRDLWLALRVRQSVMTDKSLSTDAHNVQIIAINGTVTLKGLTQTAHEKSIVALKARKIAGKGHVVNDLDVASPK